MGDQRCPTLRTQSVEVHREESLPRPRKLSSVDGSVATRTHQEVRPERDRVGTQTPLGKTDERTPVSHLLVRQTNGPPRATSLTIDSMSP